MVTTCVRGPPGSYHLDYTSTTKPTSLYRVPLSCFYLSAYASACAGFLMLTCAAAPCRAKAEDHCSDAESARAPAKEGPISGMGDTEGIRFTEMANGNRPYAPEFEYCPPATPAMLLTVSMASIADSPWL